MFSDEQIKWIGTGMFLVAAILLSSNIEISKWGFILSLIGHILLALLFFKKGDKPMYLHNASFILIDFWGMYRWFIV